MAQYLSGFIYEMTGHDHHEQVEHCIELQEPVDTQHKLQVAMDDIFEGRYFNGVRYMSHVIWRFPQYFINCDYMVEDVLYVNKWASVMEHP